MEETGGPGEDLQPVASHWQIALDNIVSSTPCLRGNRTHNVSGDMHWLHVVVACHQNSTYATERNNILIK